MASDKLKAIEYIFDQKYDGGRGWIGVNNTLRDPIVTQDDVLQAIAYSNRVQQAQLSSSNPANFLKDIVRNGNASTNWPTKLKEYGITARQVTGNKRVFAFLPYNFDQTDPFPDPYLPTKRTDTYPVQTLNMSLESKDLGRRDESWLLQTVVSLRVVESHFAFSSNPDFEVLQLVHLQMSVKLKQTEIDALYYAKCKDKKENHFFSLVTCEAKQAGERILDSQVREQVIAALSQKKLRINGHPVTSVIPIALRVIEDEKSCTRSIYLVEFPRVSQEGLNAFKRDHEDQLAGKMPMKFLPISADGLYELRPAVKGI